MIDVQFYPSTLGLQDASSVALTADGGYLYVTSPTSDSVAGFRIGADGKPVFDSDLS